jgi:uncharacterized membrane protein YkoI
MEMKRKYVVAGGVVLALAAGAVGAAAATGGADDGDVQATGAAADRAREAALARYPGAKVVSVEREDEASARWEVEVEQADGTAREVKLDREYKVVSTEADDDGGRDSERDDD